LSKKRVLHWIHRVVGFKTVRNSGQSVCPSQ
jgi:hypothetical protein